MTLSAGIDMEISCPTATLSQSSMIFSTRNVLPLCSLSSSLNKRHIPHTTGNRSLTGRTIEVLSKKMGVFLDAKGEMPTLSIKQGLFLDAKGKLTALARKRGVFLAAKMGDKKRDTLERMSP
jgi:hypothetical protein